MSGSMFVIAFCVGFFAAPVVALIGCAVEDLLFNIRDAFDRRFQKR